MSLIQQPNGCFDFDFGSTPSHVRIIAEEGSPFFGELLWREETRKPKPQDVVWTAPEGCWSGSTTYKQAKVREIQKELVLAVLPQNPKSHYYVISEKEAKTIPFKEFRKIIKVLFDPQVDFFKNIWKFSECLYGEKGFNRSDHLISIPNLRPFQISSKVFKLGKSGAQWDDGGLILGHALGEASRFHKFPPRG